MISKVEAIQKLKKAGYTVAEDNSLITIMIPAAKYKKTTIGEIKDKLKEIDYNASFSVRTYKETDEEFFDEEDEVVDDTVGLLSEDDDGQFSLASFGFDD